MKITQEKAPFQPVTVVFDDKLELEKLVGYLKTASKASAVSENYYTSDCVGAFAEQLAKFVK